MIKLSDTAKELNFNNVFNYFEEVINNG